MRDAGTSAWKAGTAGSLMVDCVRCSSSETVAAIAARLRASRPDYLEYAVVVDAGERLHGVLRIAEALLVAQSTQAADLARRSSTVGPETDQEQAAGIIAQGAALPLVVVDGQGAPLGIVPPERLLSVLAHEHREDVHRLVGMLAAGDGARRALDDPPLLRVARRVPWLIVGLALSWMATGLMMGFEELLKQSVAVAFFIPALVYVADAVGTQTEAIAVRGLSLEQRSLASLLADELAAGVLIGLLLGSLFFLAVLAVFGNVRLALGVGLSLLAAASLASGIGLLLPWLLSRLGADPAFGSGPVATIVQDISTLLIYLLVMTALAPIG